MGRGCPRLIAGTPHREMPGRSSHRYVQVIDDVQNADYVCAANRTASEFNLQEYYSILGGCFQWLGAVLNEINWIIF